MRQETIDRLHRFLEGAPLTTKSAVAGWTVDGVRHVRRPYPRPRVQAGR